MSLILKSLIFWNGLISAEARTYLTVYVKNFLRNRVTFMEMKVHAEYTFLCGNGNRVATKQRGIVRADIFNETSIVRVSGD